MIIGLAHKREEAAPFFASTNARLGADTVSECTKTIRLGSKLLLRIA